MDPHTSGRHQAGCSVLYVMRMGCRVAAAINIHRDVAAAWPVCAGYGWRPKQTAGTAAAAVMWCSIQSGPVTVRNTRPFVLTVSQHWPRSCTKFHQDTQCVWRQLKASTSFSFPLEIHVKHISAIYLLGPRIRIDIT